MVSRKDLMNVGTKIIPPHDKTTMDKVPNNYSTNKSLGKLIAARREGRDVYTASHNTVVSKRFGCKYNRCPHQNNVTCPYGITYGKHHSNGICTDRIHEVLDIVESNESTNGLRILLSDNMNILNDFIVKLQAELSTYQQLKAEKISKNDMGKGYDIDKLENNRMDDYEMNLSMAIAKASESLAKIRQDEIKQREGTKQIHTTITPQDLMDNLNEANEFVRRSDEAKAYNRAKRVKIIEEEKENQDGL